MSASVTNEVVLALSLAGQPAVVSGRDRYRAAPARQGGEALMALRVHRRMQIISPARARSGRNQLMGAKATTDVALGSGYL
jgi:hypothetical protein